MLHELPSEFIITMPNPLFKYDFRALTTKIVHDDALNDLIVTWIAAKEKAQRNIEISKRVQVIINWRSASSYPLPPLRSALPVETATDLGNPVLKALRESEKRVSETTFALTGFGMLEAYNPSEIQAQFERGKTEVEILPSDNDKDSDALDKLLVFLNGIDSRKKALYAPFDRYDSSLEYDPK